MKKNVILSGRGQLTLPADLRKKFGLEEGSVMTLEDRDGAIILRPAALFEVELYDQKQIETWMAADYLPEDEKRKLQSKLKKKTKK